MTPYKASAVILLDRDGKQLFVVVVKCTFVVGGGGEVTLAKEQPAPVLMPKFRGDPAASSLEFETDFVATKPATDVLLLGHAYAPGGRPAERVDVSMAAGPVKKSLRVYGDRAVKRGTLAIRTGEPQPFEKVPIVYERSFGGMVEDPKAKHGLSGDVRNPVGVGFDTGSEVIGGGLPNVEYASTFGSRRPAGFGPIARHWSPRRELAGTYDDRWKQERMPLVPEDFQDAFYQSAPQDQQCPSHLRGGEDVELTNLTPSGSLRFALPRVRLVLNATIAGRDDERRPVLHTVVLQPDTPAVSLVWHCAFPCQNKGHRIRDVVILEKPNLGPIGSAPAH